MSAFLKEDLPKGKPTANSGKNESYSFKKPRTTPQKACDRRDIKKPDGKERDNKIK